jgi:hypothetical protein
LIDSTALFSCTVLLLIDWTKKNVTFSLGRRKEKRYFHPSCSCKRALLTRFHGEAALRSWLGSLVRRLSARDRTWPPAVFRWGL